MRLRTSDDRFLMVRAAGSLVLANGRYWSTVAPLVRAQLERYKPLVRAIGDPTLQALAMEKLSQKAINAELTATLATLAPPTHRRHAVQAIVALEVMYDYLDRLTEQPVPDPLESGRCLYRAFLDTLPTSGCDAGNYYALYPQSDDGGYLQALVGDARAALRELPAADVIAVPAKRCTERFTEALLRAHAADRLGSGQLRQWAAREARGVGLDWPTYFAGGASCVVGLQAMVAAAANPQTTFRDAELLDELYLYVGILITILDSLSDRDSDLHHGRRPGYTRFYDSDEAVVAALRTAARRALILSREAPNGGHHAITAIGAFAHGIATQGRHNAIARELTRDVQRELQPLVGLATALVRLRLANLL